MSKKLLAAVLALSLVMSLLFVPAAAATTFDDVAADHWAANSIEKWAGYGVLEGNGDGTFAPDVVMTRAEFAAMLVKMLGLTAKSESSFTDTADHWAADFISIAVKAGIINGVGDNKFDPDEPIDFTQAAVMMCRAFGLAKNTGGDDWAKESIEKLTSLGMIGEGADEHLQVDVKCDRAVVAKLADTMVAEYVAEDRATPITGEVKGVVLVVKGAKAEIKDATLVAPVVAESATVTLTNTKADAVIVSGKDAAVTADEQSTVASVTLAGEAPKADIKGEVASVTVAEATTGAVIDAPKADENAIVNNSGTDITVNGETVSNKTDDEPSTPTDNTTADKSAADHTHDFRYAAHDKNNGGAIVWTHTKTCYNAATCKFAPVVDEDCTIVYTRTTKEGKPAHIRTCSLCNQADEQPVACTFVNGVCECGNKQTYSAGSAPAEGHTDEASHNWVTVENYPGDRAATCTAGGVQTYRCAGEGEGEEHVDCTATKTETTPALGHIFPMSGEPAAETWTTDQEPTCTKEGSKHITCTRCGFTKKLTIEKVAHDYTDAEDNVVYSAKGAKTHTKICQVCKQTVTEDHTWENGVCSVCHYECQHPTTTAIPAKAATCTVAGNKADGLKCTICGKVTKAATVIDPLGHTCTNGTEAGTGLTCSRCGEEFTCAHTGVEAGETCPVCGYAKPAAETPTSHTCNFTGATYTVDADKSTCTATCTEAGTHSVTNGKDTKSHTSGQECSYCHGTYWNNNGTWQDTDPNG